MAHPYPGFGVGKQDPPSSMTWLDHYGAWAQSTPAPTMPPAHQRVAIQPQPRLPPAILPMLLYQAQDPTSDQSQPMITTTFVMPGLPAPPKQRAPGHSSHTSASRPHLASQPQHTPLSFCDGKTIRELWMPGNGNHPDQFFGAPALYLGLHVKLCKVVGLLNGKLRAEGITTGLLDEKPDTKPFHRRKEFALKHLFGAENYAFRMKEYKAAQKDEVLREQYIQMLRDVSTYDINPASTCTICKVKPKAPAGDVGPISSTSPPVSTRHRHSSSSVRTPSTHFNFAAIPGLVTPDEATATTYAGYAPQASLKRSLGDADSEPTTQNAHERAFKRKRTKSPGASKPHQRLSEPAELGEQQYLGPAKSLHAVATAEAQLEIPQRQACTTEEGYVNGVGNDYLDASEFLFTQTFTEEDFMAEPFDLENDADVAKFMTYFQASTPPGERAQLEDAPGAKAVERVFKPAGAEAMSGKDGDQVFKDLVEW
ncbi:hypothetical protein Slin15195_G066150 [Septoria linicola]|uniref:Uncharacterized protein n=1 Tax=Septoria linicola TaxID=215465 RepID=A0A9Q9EIZ9_9PEZI|nr:hypothetical protein Slin15195_G066150 [Septoria linicola]